MLSIAIIVYLILIAFVVKQFVQEVQVQVKSTRATNLQERTSTTGITYIYAQPRNKRTFAPLKEVREQKPHVPISKYHAKEWKENDQLYQVLRQTLTA